MNRDVGQAVPSWRDSSAALSPASSSTLKPKEEIILPPPSCPSWHRCPVLKGCICETMSNNPWGIDNDCAAIPQPRSCASAERLEAARKCLPLWTQMADGVAVICLAEREDRYASACNRLHAAGLCAIAAFHRPQRPDPVIMRAQNIERPGRLGCWESHRAVATKAVQLNFQSVLIFEDDFLLLPSPEKIAGCLQQANECLGALPNESCDIFMLGGLPICGFPSPSRLFSPGGPHFDAFRVIAVCNHAYVARRRFLTTLADTSYEAHKAQRGSERPIDWFATQFRQVCYSPQFIGQTCDSMSDISAVNVSWDDRIGPIAVRFARDHPLAYDIGIYLVLPIVCLLLFILILRWLRRRLLSS